MHGRNSTSFRIVISGTGGQGVFTVTRLLCDMGVAKGFPVVSGQLHGMSQRAGAVQSSVIINGGICPVIGEGRADFVLGLEPVETARALPLMSSRTIVYMNTTPIVPYILAQRYVREEDGAQYPAIEKLSAAIRAVTPNLFTLDATELARESGSVQAVNMVMLGSLLSSGFLPCTVDDFWETVGRKIPAKFAEVSARAILRGAQAGEQFKLSGELDEAQNWY